MQITVQDTFIIRDMLPEDLPQVAAGERESHSDPWSPEIFADELSQAALEPSARLLWVLCDRESSNIAGHISLMMICGEATVNNITIYPPYRKRGLGAHLLSSALDRAKSLSCDSFTLEVRTSNLAAIRLYEKLGFSCEGIRRNYYLNPAEDAAIYWKR